MSNPGIQIMARIAQEAWWKIATKKTAEAAVKVAKSKAAKKAAQTAVKIATSEAGKRAASMAAEQGIRKVFEKKAKGPSLKRRLKKLDKMLKKGYLRLAEYEILRKQLIESFDVAGL